MSSPIIFSSAKKVVGRRIKEARLGVPFTVLELSIEVGIHQARLTRIEQGRLLPRDDEVAALMNKLSIPTCEIEEIRQLVDDERTVVESFAPVPLDKGGPSTSEVQAALFDELSSVYEWKWFEVVGVPGILQTRPYIESVFSTSLRRGKNRFGTIDDDVRKAAAIRSEGQKFLYDNDRSFDFLIAEDALLHKAPPGVMAAQCAHLVLPTYLSNVSIGVIPKSTLLSHSFAHGFRVLDNDCVQVDNPLGYTQYRARYQVDSHLEQFEVLREFAVYGDEVRELLMRVAGEHSSSG